MARLESPKESSTSSEPQLPPKQISWRAQMARYVVSVDGQAKSSYATREAAEAEAQRISARFPILQVRVSDWQRDTVYDSKEPGVPA